MKNTIVFATLLIASVAFGADAKKKMATAAAPAVTKADVTGSLKWTGYGVGKSHSGDLNIKNGSIDLL